MIVSRSIKGVEFDVDISKRSSLLCDEQLANIIKGDTNNLIEHIYEVDNEYTPLVATFEITNNCNFNCRFCYINTQSNKDIVFASFSEIKKDFKYLIDQGLLMIYLTGGEVLSHPEFFEIYRFFKEQGVFVVLLTNLSLLSAKHIELFRELPPYRITTSIYGISDKQFNYVTLEKAGAKPVLDNILLLKNVGIFVTCQTPLNKITQAEIDDIKIWCLSNNIKYTSSSELSDTYDGVSLQSLKIEEETKEDFKKVKGDFNFKNHFDCRAGKHTFVVSYDYKLRPCFMLFGDDVKVFDINNNIKAALYEMISYINNMRSKVIDGCKGCFYSDYCFECLFTQQNKDIRSYMKAHCLKLSS